MHFFCLSMWYFFLIDDIKCKIAVFILLNFLVDKNKKSNVKNSNNFFSLVFPKIESNFFNSQTNFLSKQKKEKEEKGREKRREKRREGEKRRNEGGERGGKGKRGRFHSSHFRYSFSPFFSPPVLGFTPLPHPTPFFTRRGLFGMRNSRKTLLPFCLTFIFHSKKLKKVSLDSDSCILYIFHSLLYFIFFIFIIFFIQGNLKKAKKKQKAKKKRCLKIFSASLKVF